MTLARAETKRAYIEENLKNGSSTAAKQPNPIAGNKPFVKGDPRINRNGRPRSFDQARALAQQIAHEELTAKDGTKLTVADAILRKWARGDHAAQKSFMELAFGKVPDKIESDVNLKTKHVLHWPHERPDLVPSNGSNDRN